MPFFRTDISDFAQLRGVPGNVYIDKTREIARLADPGQPSTLFLSRPRRFGKTLLVSTLEALFQGRQDLFAGTWLGQPDHWDWTQPPYTVIRLDMTEITGSLRDLSVLEKDLYAGVTDLYAQFALSLPVVEHRAFTLFRLLIERLAARAGQGVVVLVDEYDRPLVQNMSRPDLLPDILETMQDFYGILKSRRRDIHFTFMTGTTRVARAGLFSGANHFHDLSFAVPAGTLLGYTRADMHNNADFMASVVLCARNLGCSVPSLLAALEDHYNGYRFADRGEPVCNPYSLNACLQQLLDPDTALSWDLDNLPNVWVESGQSRLLFSAWRNHLRSASAPKFPDTLLQADISAVQKSNFDVADPDLLILMYQAGYLTRKQIRDPATEAWRDVPYFPNREVALTYHQTFLDWFGKELARWRTEGTVPRQFRPLRAAVERRTASALSGAVNDLLALMPYTLHTPATRKENAAITMANYEVYCQLFLFMALHAVADEATPEMAAHRGRMDLGVPVDGHILIFELKVDSSADRAGRQALARGYASRWRGSDRAVTICGLNFNTATHQLDGCVLWELGRFDQETRMWDREPFAGTSLYTLDVMAAQDFDRERFVAEHTIQWHDQDLPQTTIPLRPLYLGHG